MLSHKSAHQGIRSLNFGVEVVLEPSFIEQHVISYYLELFVDPLIPCDLSCFKEVALSFVKNGENAFFASSAFEFDD